MKRLRSILVLFLLFSAMFMANEKVDASAGRLKSGSITTCNGTMYGEHAGHWHIAVKRGSYYYPSGSPVAKPCKAKKKKSANYSYSYNSGSSSKKAVANNKVKSDESASKNEADKEKDDVDKDVDTLKDQENSTPEVSNFTDSDKKTQDSGEEEDSNPSVMTGFVAGLIGGVGGSYLVRRKRSKKKKDDLTNW